MAESRGSLLAKSVQKHAGRAKEKILQNLGKVDRTADEIFDEHLQNFNRQQNAAGRLQKEFNNYIRCVRALQTASKTLLDSVAETYEPQWYGYDQFQHHQQSVDNLWADFTHKLGEQVLIPLNTYQQQFPEMKKKIDKRGRKLVDYDSQRHSFQALQSNLSKRKDEVKIARGREQLDDAKRTYEMLNSELHDELPALHDSRVLFFVTNLQSLFSAEQLFHVEVSKIFGEFESIVDKLATDSQRSSYAGGVGGAVKKLTTNGGANNNGTNSLPKANNIIVNQPESSGTTPERVVLDSPKNSAATTENSHDIESPCKTPPLPLYANCEEINTTHSPTITTTTTNTSSAPLHTQPSPPKTPPPPPSPQTNPEKIRNGNSSGGDQENSHKSDGNNSTPDNQTPTHHHHPSTNTAEATNEKTNIEELYDIPIGASTDNLPPGVLYRCKATYKYNREDEDELSFDVGEIIHVIEYEDPDEQEEGWLMGIKENTNEKGMFPANFTKHL